MSIIGHKIYIFFYSPIKNTSGQTVSGVFLCLFLLLQYAGNTVASSNSEEIASTPRTVDYQPFDTRDQNLFNLIHGQALPTNARLNDPSQAWWSSSLVITNTINAQSFNDENIVLDYEAYRFNFSYQYGLTDNWNLRLDVPLIHQSGGTFDSAIDQWHNIFGLPNGQRPLTQDNQYNIQYNSQAQNQINLNESSTTLGDIQIAVARSVIKNSATTMSLWASIKLPTGDENKLSGSGAVDVSTWLAVNQQLSEKWLLNMNAGVVVLGKDSYQGIPLSDHALYGHLMLGWLITDRINLKAQLQAHTSYYDKSQLDILADTYLLTVGTAIKINNCQQLDFAISEDIKVDGSPDISLLINWRSYTSHCQ